MRPARAFRFGLGIETCAVRMGTSRRPPPTSGGALATILLQEGNADFNRAPGMISLYYSRSQLMEKCPGQLLSRRSPHIRFPRSRCAPGPSRRAFSSWTRNSLDRKQKRPVRLFSDCSEGGFATGRH